MRIGDEIHKGFAEANIAEERNKDFPSSLSIHAVDSKERTKTYLSLALAVKIVSGFWQNKGFGAGYDVPRIQSLHHLD